MIGEVQPSLRDVTVRIGDRGLKVTIIGSVALRDTTRHDSIAPF